MLFRSTTNIYSREFYIKRLIGAGIEIIMRADDMLGEIDGVQNIKVSFEIAPSQITSINVQKSYISEYKQYITNNKEES